MTEETKAPARRGRPPGSKNASPAVNAEFTDYAEVDRREMRPEMAKSNSVDRAAQRLAEIRSHTGAKKLDSADRFTIDSNLIPPGWSYEWKRKSIMGKEDPAYEVELARGGWEPVPATRHASMMPKGRYETIERDGMILMERPRELTEEAHTNDLRRARLQVRHKEAQLTSGPDGTFERERPLVKKSFEAMKIPE